MSDTNNENVTTQGQSQEQRLRLVNFLYEAGMLRRTPRSGFQFLGSGTENVAEHSFRTAIIGFALAGLAGVPQEHVTLLCLFHDFHEARTGDFNYVNKLYNSCDAKQAMQDAVEGTGLETKVLSLWEEGEEGRSTAALLAQDADQLDLILRLCEERDLGNTYAKQWLDAAVQRLQTPEARQLCELIVSTDHTDWWFKATDPSWWAKKQKSASRKG